MLNTTKEKKSITLLDVWTVIILLFRPSIFGERFNYIVFLVFLIVSSLIIFNYRRTGLRVEKNLYMTSLVVLSTLFYFLIQGLLLSDAKKTVINSCILLIVVTV